MNTIIEKIRAEVEYSRDLNYKYYVKQGIGSPAEYRYDEDVRILSFLSALEQEEKPMNPQPVKIDIRKELASIEFMGVNDARDTETIARHFYELGCRRTAEKYDEIEYKRQRADVCEGLEEEVKAWHKKHFKSRNAWEDYSGHYLDKNSQLDLARHFAKWGAEHRGSSETPKEIEEAAKMIYPRKEGDLYSLHSTLQRAAFKAGASWQKERDEKELSEKIASAYQLGLADKEKQMMKEAVEGEVFSVVPNRGAVWYVASYPDVMPLRNRGDNVRIIILPKEDKK